VHAKGGSRGLGATAFVQMCAALAALGAGAIHFSASGEHVGLFAFGFVAMGVFQASWALLVALRPSAVLLWAGLAGNAAIVAIWLTAHTNGLPFGPTPGEPEATGVKDLMATGFELLAVAGAFALLHAHSSARLGSLRVPAAGTALAATAAALLTGVAVATPHAHGPHGHGGQGHSSDQAAVHDHGNAAGAQHTHGGMPLADAGHSHGTDAASGAHSHDASHAAGAAGHSATGHGHGRGAAAGTPIGVGHVHTGAGHAGGAHGAQGHAGGGARSHAHDHRGGGGGRGSHGGHSSDRGDAGRGHESHGGHGGHGAEQGQGEHGGGQGGGEGDEPESGIVVEAGRPGEGGTPGRGPAVVLRGQGNPETNGAHPHGGDAGCTTTPDQDAAADRLYRQTEAALQRYENAPHRALADGFYYAFGPTDRTMHMVNPDRMRDPTILDAGKIESFLYAITDRGLVPIAGMYIMPKYGMHGPEIGGCRTKWHYHGGLGGRLASAGSMEETPEMLHVWTYPGLDPYGDYDGREISQLWAPGRYTPSVCRKYGDANDVCLP
jgi:hypothetical protein